MLIMTFLTALEVLALVVSSSELRITNNFSEDKLMFGFGEQGVDRILSHLHYMAQGLFGKENGIAMDMGALGTPLKVWDNNVRNLYLHPNWTPGSNPSQHSRFKMTAYLDVKDKESNSTIVHPNMDIGHSRKVAISVRVRNLDTGYEKAFRAWVQPTSIWDLAYFSKNHTPDVRSDVSGCSITENSAQSWYDCHATFHQEDFLSGSVFVRNADNSPDDGALFFRGGPVINGDARWRSVRGYGSYNQTAGGSGGGAPRPKVAGGIKKQAKDINLFPIEYVTNGRNPRYFYKTAQNAGMILRKRNTCGPNGSPCVWKIIFRNDYDLDGDGVYEESQVASAITRANNNGAQADPDDPGAMLIYSIPYDLSREVDMRAAYYGNNARERHKIMTHSSVGGEIYSPSVSWKSLVRGGCTLFRDNSIATATLRPYETLDINPGTGYRIFLVPSMGRNLAGFGGSGTCSTNSSGIIFVEGDVLVSGVLDGKTTIVATGDIILDHEVQYEEHPSRFHLDPGGVLRQNPHNIDMLALIATGSVIIPNSRPVTSGPPPSCTTLGLGGERCFYLDDWSDPSYDPQASGNPFIPRAWLDSASDNADDGDEEIHAIMISLGRKVCTSHPSSGVASCAPLNPNSNAGDRTTVQNFSVGVYATPRTDNGLPRGAFYGSSWDTEGNESGVLTIWGAVIQNYSGRFSYDHNSSGSCSMGSGSGCRNMGHKIALNYDPHLKYSLPAMPYDYNNIRAVPFGLAAWDIVDWQRTDPSGIGDNVW